MLISMLGSVLVKMLSGYMMKLASQEFCHWALFKIAEAIVKNTETKEDDVWLEKIKNVVEK